MTNGIAIDWTTLPNAADHLPWYRNKGLRTLFFYCSILFTGEALIGYDGTIIGSLQALAQWNKDMGYPDSSKIGLLNAVPFFSGIVMGPLNALIVDRFGRRWPIRFFGLTMIIGTILGCVAGIKPSSGYGLFIASKTIIGFGITAHLMTAQILLQEISHPRYRVRTAGLYDAFYPIGATCGTLITFGCTYLGANTWLWASPVRPPREYLPDVQRIPYLVQLLPALYIVIAVQFMPESPRFHLARGHPDVARAFVIRHHANGDEGDELANFEYEEIKATLAEEVTAVKLSFMDLVRAPGNKHRFGLVSLMTFMPQCNGSSIILFYYTVMLKLAGIGGASKLTGLGVGINMAGLLSMLVGITALPYLRRRRMVLVVWPILMILLVALGVSTRAFLVSGKTNRTAGNAAVAMIWLFKVTQSFLGPLFYSYPAEILNYTTRGKGMAVWNTVNQAWGAYGSYVNSIALNNISWRYYLVFLPILSIQWVLAYFYMVETRGLTLEEVAIAFEGERSFAAHAAEHAAEVVGHPEQDNEKGDEKDGQVATMAQIV